MEKRAHRWSLRARILSAAYCIAAGVAALGQQLSVDRQPVSLDEAVIVRATLVEGSRGGPPRLDADGLTLRFDSGGGCMQCVWVGTVQRPGRLTVGPLYAADGRVLIDQRRTIDVLPAPAIPADDPKRSVAMLRQSRLIPAYVHAEVKPQRVAVGQEAIVTYSLITDDERIHDATVAPLPAIQRARVYPLDGDRVTYHAEPVAEGSSIRKSVVRRFSLIPTEAGTLRIEPFEVTGIMAPEDVGPERLYHQPSARRLSPPVTLDVVPRDPSIDLIAWRPSLLTLPEEVRGATQSVLVLLGGFGELRDVPAPRFATPLDSNVAVRIDDVGATFTVTPNGLRSQHQWRMWFTAKEGRVSKLPPVTLRALDPRTNDIVELSAKLDGVYLTAAPAPQAAAPPPPAAAAVKRPLLAVGKLFDRYGWILLVAAIVYLWRVMRASR